MGVDEMEGWPPDTAKLTATDEGRLSHGRKIPLGMQCVLDPISPSGTAPLAIGVFLLLAPLGFGMIGWALITMMLPWYWSDAGVATITAIEPVQQIDGGSAAKISYVYDDPQGLEHKGSAETVRKKDFFVKGRQYPILKYRDEWRMTVLADLEFWERHPYTLPLLMLWGLGAAFVLSGLFTRFIGRRISRWKMELLRTGVYAEGVFSHEETAPIYWRIFGLKNKMFLFVTESGEQCVAMFVRRRSKKEPAEVDVFYDPAKPHCSFVLQSLAARRFFWYSPEDDRLMTSSLFTAIGLLGKACEYAFWGLVLWMLVSMIFF